MFLCISQCNFWLCRRCEGCQGLHRSKDVLTAVQAITGLGQGMSPAWPRHCWSSLPFLLSAWQLPLLSPLPWQCQPRSHGVSACASARQTRSHAGLEPRSRHCPRSRMATARAGGLTQPQNSVGMEMDTSPHSRGEVWVGSRGRRRGLHLEYLPGLPHSGYNRVPSTTAGPLCPTATPGSATAPLCWYQPTVPKAISTSIRLH